MISVIILPVKLKQSYYTHEEYLKIEILKLA